MNDGPPSPAPTSRPPAVVLDTNVLVAAAFNRSSASAAVVEAVREERLRLVWDQATRDESEHILRKIPPLSWSSMAGLYQPEHCFEGPTHPADFHFVPDPDDRKFAALAAATGATLITMDEHLLAHRDRPGVSIEPPRRFLTSSE